MAKGLGEWIGTIGWRTEVDTSGAVAGIHDAEDEVRDTVRRIDGMEGHAEIGLDLKELEKDAAVARKIIRDLEKEKIDIQAKIETTSNKGWLTRYRKELKAVDDQLTVHKQNYKTLSEEIKHTTRLTKAQTAAEKAQHRERVAAFNKIHQQAIEEDRWRSKSINRIHQMAKEEDRWRDAQAKDAARNQAAIEKEINALPKLRHQYAMLAAARNKKIADGGKGIFGQGAGWKMGVGDKAHLASIEHDMDALSVRIRQVGGDIDGLDASVDDNRSRMTKWGASIANIRVHMGIMSLTLRQAGIAMATMGPMLMNIVGAASALVGVVGGALVGAAGAGGAALTAMGLGAFGIVQAMGPMSTDIGLASDAFQELSDAEAEFGKNSKEAKDAAKALDDILGQVGKRAGTIAKLMNELSTGFEKLTQPTRNSMADLYTMGLERAMKLMPAFAKQTNDMAQGFEVAGANFLKAFDFGEMESSMNKIMGNFSNALPELGSALGNIANAMANIFAEFSEHFDGIADGLLKWSEGFLASTENAQGLSNTIDGLMQSAETFVDFLGSATDLLSTFFGMGQQAGRGLMDDMTAQMDDWTKSMENNPEGIKSWFDDTVDGAKELWAVLKPLGATFVDVATSMQPFTSALLEVLETVAELVAAFTGLNIGGLNIGGALVTALGGAAGLSLVGKLATSLPLVGTAFATMGARAGTAVRGMAGLPPVIARTTTATTGARNSFSAYAAQTSKAAGATGLLSKAAGVARTGIGALAGPVGIAVTGGLLLADAFGLFGDSSAELEAAVAQSNSALGQQATALDASATAMLGVRGQILALGPALRQGGSEGKQAAYIIRQGFTQLRADLDNTKQAIDEFWTGTGKDQFEETYGDLVSSKWFDTAKFEASVQKHGKITDAWAAKLSETFGEEQEDVDAFNESIAKMPGLLDEGRQAAAAITNELANLQRQQKGFDLLGANARGSIQGLLKDFDREEVLKMSVQFDSKQAQTEALKLANDLRRMGGGEAMIMRIMAKDQGAGKTIADLERKKQQLKSPTAIPIKMLDKGVKTALDSINQDKQKVAKPVRMQIRLAQQGVKQALDAINKEGDDVKKPRTMPINDKGGDETKRKLDDINRTKLEEKTVPVDADTSAFDNAIGSIIGSVLGTAFVAISAIGKGTGGRTGGTLTNRGSNAVSDSWEVPGYATGGGYISKPMFLVGEEAPSHPEFVIATNPAYRQDNVGYWMQAGRMLGINGFAQGGSPSGDYQSGGVSLDQAQTEYDLADEKYQKEKDKKKKKRDDKLLRKLSQQRANAKANLEAVEKVNSFWDTMRAQIERADAVMEAAAATGDMSEVNGWKSRKIGYIEDLIKSLTNASRDATGEHRATMLGEVASLRTMRENVDDWRPGTEGMLEGNEAERLAKINRASALAGLTRGITDDREAALGLVDFWEDVLGRMRGSGAPPEHITEVATQLKAARDASISIGSGGIVSGGNGGVFSQAREDLYKSFGSNTIWEGAGVSPFSAPESSGGSSVTVNNSFPTPPPDPHTWSEQQSYELATMGI